MLLFWLADLSSWQPPTFPVGILYFYTRATTVSISLPAVLSSSVSFLIESVSNRWLLERNVRGECDAINYQQGFNLFSVPCYLLAFQQLWLVSRLQIKSSGKGRNFFRWIPTLARVPADHSERQSRREDEEFPIHYRLMVSDQDRRWGRFVIRHFVDWHNHSTFWAFLSSLHASGSRASYPASVHRQAKLSLSS